MILAMHIPNGVVGGIVCPVTAFVAVLGIIGALVVVLCAPAKPLPTRFASIAAFIFAAQMINFPVMGGTSGHLLGGVLAASLLGVPAGILAISLVVAVQCFLFADGGIFALGANILNMALIGAGIGGLLARKSGGELSFVRIAVASWVSVFVAALACCFELALSGTAPLSVSLFPMLSIHALIGLGEALLTVSAVAWFSHHSAASTHSSANSWAPLTAAFCIALLVSPFASKLPDGLDWSVALLGIDEKVSGLVFSAPFADYVFPVISQEVLSTSIAGLLGCAVVFAVGWFLAKAFERKAV